MDACLVSPTFSLCLCGDKLSDPCSMERMTRSAFVDFDTNRGSVRVARHVVAYQGGDSRGISWQWCGTCATRQPWRRQMSIHTSPISTACRPGAWSTSLLSASRPATYARKPHHCDEAEAYSNSTLRPPLCGTTPSRVTMLHMFPELELTHSNEVSS